MSDLVELHSNLTKTTLYPRESTQLSTRLIVKADPRRLQNPNIIAPNAQGLTIEPIGEPNQYQAVVDGVEVTVVDHNYLVTAIDPGQFTISGIGFKGSVVYGDNRSGTTKLVSADTPATEFQISVEAIPSDYQGQWLPASYLTLTQDWRDSSGKEIDPSQPYTTTVGESITREIYLDIQGLASEQFPDLKIDYPKSVRLYQEKPQFTDLGNGKTRMTVKQVLIAQQQGQIDLKPVTLNWWDSSNHKQETASLNRLQLIVEPASTLNAESISAPPPAAQQTQSVTVYKPGIWPYLTGLFALLWLITIVLWKKSSKGNSSIEPQTIKSTTEDKLKSALAMDDKVQANFLLSCWLAEHPDIESVVREKIEQERAAMNLSNYSQSGQKWQAKELLSLLKKGKKSSAKNKSKDDVLASL